RVIDHNSFCPVCGCEIEDTLYALRDCLATKEACLQVIPIDRQSHFFSESLQDWLTSNLRSQVSIGWAQQFDLSHRGNQHSLPTIASQTPMPNTWVNLFTDAKLWGILDGLLVMLSKGFKRAMIQTYNLEVARSLQENMMTDSGIIMLKRVRRIMRTEGQQCIRYVPKDFNKVADCLVKLSLVRNSRLQVYDRARMKF
ncbi:hypothetical protein Golob_026793, partial [Gossypium lobatum]|nr:hypothetical protein [Gossypium lobatum]